MNNKNLTAMKEEQGLISANDLADLAGVSLQSVLNYVKRGELLPANEDTSGRMFFQSDQILTVCFLKKGRSTRCNNILCLCFSDNLEELENYEDKAIEYFQTYQSQKEEKSVTDVVDIFKEYNKITASNRIIGIQRIDDLESAYNDHRESNNSAIINSTDFQDEIDKMIEDEIIERLANYETKLLKSISRCKLKGLNTSDWGDDLPNEVERKKRELIKASESPEFRELFIQKKGNALINKYLWRIFERDYLMEGYYSLRTALVSNERKEYLDILTLILRGEYKQVFVMGYDMAPDVVKQTLQVLESLHRVLVVREF